MRYLPRGTPPPPAVGPPLSPPPAVGSLPSVGFLTTVDSLTTVSSLPSVGSSAMLRKFLDQYVSAQMYRPQLNSQVNRWRYPTANPLIAESLYMTS